jgi:hypothetical protein
MASRFYVNFLFGNETSNFSEEGYGQLAIVLVKYIFILIIKLRSKEINIKNTNIFTSVSERR